MMEAMQKQKESVKPNFVINRKEGGTQVVGNSQVIFFLQIIQPFNSHKNILLFIFGYYSNLIVIQVFKHYLMIFSSQMLIMQEQS